MHTWFLLYKKAGTSATRLKGWLHRGCDKQAIQNPEFSAVDTQESNKITLQPGIQPGDPIPYCIQSLTELCKRTYNIPFNTPLHQLIVC